MSSKSFVVQYIIKARDRFSAAARNITESTKRMRAAVSAAQSEFVRLSSRIRQSERQMRSIPSAASAASRQIRRLSAVSATAAAGQVALNTTMSSTNVQLASGSNAVVQSTSAWGAFAAAVNQSHNSLASLGQAFENVRNKGLIMSAAITLPVVLGARAMSNAASDAEETKSKFAVVFRDVSAKAEGMATSLAESYGLTVTESKELLGNTADLLTGFGFTQKAALELSDKVQKLAVDLVSFTNFSGGVEVASQALTKALLGEAEQVKQLGIVINQDTKEYKALFKMVKRTTGVSDAQTKALVALKMAYDQSGNSIDDYSNTLHQLANQQRLTSTRVSDMKEAFGLILMPVAMKLTKAIRRLVVSLTELSTPTKKMLLIFAGVLAVIGPLLIIVGALGMAIPYVAAGFTGISLAAAAASASMTPIIIIAGLLALAGFLIVKNWDKLGALFSSLFSGISAGAGETFGRLIDKVKEAAGIFVEFFGGDSDAFGTLNEFAQEGRLIGDIIGGAMDIILRGIMGVGEAMGQLIAAAFSLDFSNFDVEAIKAQFMGGGESQGVDLSNKSRVDVGVNVGLAPGLEQTEAPVIKQLGTRRADVGMGASA